MLGKIKNFIAYLLGKKSEVMDLESKDVMLAGVVLDIHRKRSHSSKICVPLFALKQIHAIDRDNAIEATEKRVDILRNSRDALLRHPTLTREILNEFLPSVSGIKVVEQNEVYIAFEGNGRLVALQKVFEESDGIELEVELYHFKNPKRILRRVDKVRERNHLI